MFGNYHPTQPSPTIVAPHRGAGSAQEVGLESRKEPPAHDFTSSFQRSRPAHAQPLKQVASLVAVSTSALAQSLQPQFHRPTTVLVNSPLTYPHRFQPSAVVDATAPPLSAPQVLRAHTPVAHTELPPLPQVPPPNEPTNDTPAGGPPDPLHLSEAAMNEHLAVGKAIPLFPTAQVPTGPVFFAGDWWAVLKSAPHLGYSLVDDPAMVSALNGTVQRVGARQFSPA